ncbi:hypothetical protein SESBI_46774 [Sesbania bispinosa]|nr:hypothetical protein SESBI_46774 [Sesbania bispinosa]
MHNIDDGYIEPTTEGGGSTVIQNAATQNDGAQNDAAAHNDVVNVHGTQGSSITQKDNEKDCGSIFKIYN